MYLSKQFYFAHNGVGSLKAQSLYTIYYTEYTRIIFLMTYPYDIQETKQPMEINV